MKSGGGFFVTAIRFYCCHLRKILEELATTIYKGRNGRMSIFMWLIMKVLLSSGAITGLTCTISLAVV